uniref:Uncharacterized protein n=1 Tax=Lygus hesperus TaxID=30085 RepID=A0A146M2A3_LYGHE
MKFPETLQERQIVAKRFHIFINLFISIVLGKISYNIVCSPPSFTKKLASIGYVVDRLLISSVVHFRFSDISRLSTEKNEVTCLFIWKKCFIDQEVELIRTARKTSSDVLQ